MVVALSTIGAAHAPAQAPEDHVTAAATRGIADIEAFLDQCPQNDPAFSSILLDFSVRRNGQTTTVPFCSEPLTAMPIEQVTDELIVWQTLRTIYYMDRGQSGHLPWTPLTLYDWMRAKIDGVQIRTPGGVSCCATIAGKVYINIPPADAFNRDFDRGWRGIASNIDVYAHEARHIDGFPHSSCCGTANGCDDTFNLANLSPYGIQWWLNAAWLNGDINVGYACGTAAEANDATNWFLSSISGFRSRFCQNRPAEVVRPAAPGGRCSQLGRRRAVRR
jgi:hypothetical protein